MKTARKALMLILCAALLVSATVMGTLAYLTSNDSVTNTFTVGNIQIKLDESNEATNDPNDRTETGNAYADIQPGQKYVKDPTVTVLKDSEDCYVRMLVTVTYNDAADDVLAKHEYQKWFDFNADWNAQTNVKTVKADGKTSRTYEFRYKNIVTTTTEVDNKLPALFTKITVPGAIINTELATLEGLKIDIVAQAVQAAGFMTDVDGAWSAFDNQHA